MSAGAIVSAAKGEGQRGEAKRNDNTFNRAVAYRLGLRFWSLVAVFYHSTLRCQR